MGTAGDTSGSAGARTGGAGGQGASGVAVADPVDARTAILAAARAALGDVPTTEGVDAPVERGYVRDRSFPDPVGRFLDRARESGATSSVCAPSGVADAVADALAGVDGPVVRAAGLPQEWCCAQPPLEADDGRSGAAAMARFAAGVTGAAVAIAETGTVVLDTGGATGRRLVSLVPDRHVCVVREQDVVADVPQAVARLDPRRPLTFVTGPSATVDIELVRTVGVHGPRSLHVVVVREDAPG